MKLVDREVARKKRSTGKASRSEFLAELVRRYFLGQHGGAAELRRAHGEIRGFAARLKAHGDDIQERGDPQEARRAFLLAAAKELEALALVAVPDEKDMIGDLMEIISLLKKGTGYRHLPEVSVNRADRPSA